MRDVERLKEKIQISLDGRQVWALGLSGLVLLGGVFTLGVLTGRKSAPPAPGIQGDLSALDAAAQNAPPAPAPQALPARSPAPAPKAALFEAKAQELEVKEATLAAPAADRTAGSEDRDPPVLEKAAQGRAPAHATVEPRPAAVVSASRPATVVAAPQRPVQIASNAPVALTSAPREKGEFTVQIGASQDRAEALRMENKARAAGLRPYSVAADLGPKGVWYRVRVGAFHDKDAASRYQKDVERELRASAVVMSAR